jgi:hypothetical protein
LFYGNFNAEYELAGRCRSLSAAVRRLTAELPAVWAGIASAGDAIFAPEPFDDEWLALLTAAGLPAVPVLGNADLGSRSFDLCPWEWSPNAVDWGAQRNFSIDPPPLHAVRTANSRVFSLELERDWNIGLPGASIVRSLAELPAALERLPAEFDRWVLKAEFGMSGRERLRGQGRELTNSAHNWVRNRVRRNETLVLEPWVERNAEVGLQFTLPRSGEVVLEGVTGLLADTAGVYRGSRFDTAVAGGKRWTMAISVATRAAKRIQQLGYFGPLGIDAVEYRDIDGNPRIRPLQDVNARFTMGRLALGFRKLLRPGEAGVWLHQQWPAGDVAASRPKFERFCAALPRSVRAVRTSPFVIGDRPVGHGTALLMGSEGDLADAKAI